MPEDIFEIIKKQQKGNSEEESEEEEEGEKEKQPQQPQSQQPTTASTETVDRNVILQSHIQEARVRFLISHPEMESIINDLHYIALSLLNEDIKSNKLRSNDFKTYLEDSVEIYKKYIEDRAKNLPITTVKREGSKDKKKTKELSPEDFLQYYRNEYLPDITHKRNIVENIVAGIPTFMQGRSENSGFTAEDLRKQAEQARKTTG